MRQWREKTPFNERNLQQNQPLSMKIQLASLQCYIALVLSVDLVSHMLGVEIIRIVDC